jgi:hypothetical protein
MNKCPKLVHTSKGRERALKYVKGLSELNSNSKYTYKLYHEYDAHPSDVYVETSIEPSVFELLIARILFEAAEIDERYAICQTEIANPILNSLYGLKVSSEENMFNEEFDLYYVWEKWCGLYSDVMKLEVFNNEKVKDALEKIIPLSA